MMIGDQVTCSVCGTVYNVTKHKLPARDKDSIECCKKTLLSWNGGVMYSIQEKPKAT